MLVRVDWVKQGTINWGQAWVERHGQTRSRIPGLDDHISFVNHDLQRNGYPRVEKSSDGSLVIDVPDSGQTPIVADILGYHGFVIR